MPFDALTFDLAFLFSVIGLSTSLPPENQRWYRGVEVYDANPGYGYGPGADVLVPTLQGPMLPYYGPENRGSEWAKAKRKGESTVSALPGTNHRTSLEKHKHRHPAIGSESGAPFNQNAQTLENSFSSEGSTWYSLQGGREGKPPPSSRPAYLDNNNRRSSSHSSAGSKSSRPSGGSGAQIIFPDEYEQMHLTPRASKCMKNPKATFCEDVGTEYPTQYIGKVLKEKGAMFQEFFGKDTIISTNITHRINTPDEDSLCPFSQEVIFPKAAQNKDNKWHFIVNQDKYVQGVTVEVCLNEGKECSHTSGFPLGYKPYCKQKYIGRRLVAIGENGTLFSDSFWLPSCCSCVVRYAP